MSRRLSRAPLAVTSEGAVLLSAALFARFTSQGEGDFADRLLSALRFQFGGHGEKGPAPKGGGS